MRTIFSILLVLLWISSAHCQETPRRANVDPKLTHWLKTNVSAKTGLPLSFHITDELKAKTNQAIGPADSLTAIIERIIIEEGISIYDTALWQITLSVLGGEDNVKAASLPVEIYYTGYMRELKSIRSGYPNQPFIYDPENPLSVASDLNALGKRGFLFRILNAHGKYNTTDPLDGKSRFKGFPTWPTVHWEDRKPIAGEDAWVVIAAMHLYHKKYFDPPARECILPMGSGCSIPNILRRTVRHGALLNLVPKKSISGSGRAAHIGCGRIPEKWPGPLMRTTAFWVLNLPGRTIVFRLNGRPGRFTPLRRWPNIT